VPLVVHGSLAFHSPFLQFLQSPILLLTRGGSPSLARYVRDLLHIYCVMIAGVRSEETIVAVQWVDQRFLLREERSRKAA